MRLSYCAFPLTIVLLAGFAGCGGGKTSVQTPASPVLTAMVVTPAAVGLTIGANQQFIATGQYQDGTTKNLTSQVAWSSSASSIATISSGGRATTLAAGTSTISAALGGVSGSTTLSVTAALTSVVVTPIGPGIPVGATQQFAATGGYQDGSTKDLTLTANWSSSATSIATINSSGLATGVAGGFSTITATSGSISGSTAITVNAPTPSPIQLSGDYAFTITGVDSRGPQFFAGVFHADGSGNLSGVEDANIATGVHNNASLTGTYNIFSDGRGNMTLNVTGLPSHDFRFIMKADGSVGKMIEFDGAGNSVGTFERQDPAALNTSALNGNYVFRLKGIDATTKVMAEAGLFTADGAGNIANGTQDVNPPADNPPSFTGTYSVSTNGRGTATFSTSGGTANFALYVVSNDRVNLIELDPGASTVLAGTAEKQSAQSFSTASLAAGGYVLFLEHAPGLTRGVFEKIAQVMVDGSGSVTAGVQDEDSSAVTNTITGGSYLIAANGRGTLHETTILGDRDFVFYMLSATRMFIMEIHDRAAVGTAEAQVPGAGFNNSSLSGTYGFTGSEVGETQTGISVELVADGAGHLSGTGDLSVSGVQSAVVLSGTYAVPANGRVTVTLAKPVGVQGLILYLVSPSRAIVLGEDPDLDGTLDLN